MITHFKGNRSPSLTDTIRVDGVAFDLTTSTVKLKMRLDTTTTLKVNTAAVVVSAAAGTVRYDWASGDVDTAGHYLAWWEVTLPSGKLQETPAFVIVIHDPDAIPAYVDLETFKTTTALSGQTYANADIGRALVAASRGIDQALNRRFFLDADAAQVRYYTPTDYWELEIDDLVAVTSVLVDRTGDGVYEETWVRATDYEFAPVNALANGRPYECLQVLRGTNRFWNFPCFYVNAVKITGQFGWATVPEGVKQLTTLIASRLVQRTRQAPFGIIALGGDGAAVRASGLARDPEYAWLVEGLERTALLV